MSTAGRSQDIMGKLFRARFKGSKELRKIIDGPKPRRGPAKATPRAFHQRYMKGIYRGNYFKIKLPPKQSRFPDVPKLPQTLPTPKPFVQPKPSTPSPEEIRQAAGKVKKPLSKRVVGWARANWAVLVLNMGSVASLIGFTRSDILELRTLSLTGSLTGLMYLSVQERVLWPSIIWGCLFSCVNSFKIYQIFQERNASVYMSKDEEDMFVQFFMPHGVTPKQFERILKKAKRVPVKKGEFIIRKGEPIENVFLVIKGGTRAHVLGRHLTAASTGPQIRRVQHEGGDSGAWIGEMAFLDFYWEKQQGRDAHEAQKSIYTIFAHTDCELLGWSHEEMEKLMGTSTDMRAALTRAMTSALVGKVVNMTVSRSSKVLPTWSMWLADWRNNDGATVKLHSVQRLAEDTDEFRGKSAQNHDGHVEEGNADKLVVKGGRKDESDIVPPEEKTKKKRWLFGLI